MYKTTEIVDQQGEKNNEANDKRKDMGNRKTPEHWYAGRCLTTRSH